MDALQQRVEVETVAVRRRHHDLAIDHALVCQRRLQRLDQLGEVPGERPLVAARELDTVAVAEHDAAEAVPFRLVVPSVADGNLVSGLRQHR